jgi:2-polyprenyl-6-methoxyphenol hydroxylase-like FAD-dependent oxidoreductase
MGQDADILVAGAGPTGLALCAELRRRGLGPRLVDAADHPSRHSKALAVHAGTLERLDRLGVTKRLVQAGLPVRAVEIHARGRRLARLAFHELPSVHPFVLSIPQAETERILEERLGELGGEVERGTALRGLRQDGDGVHARLERPGGGEETRARWLVGCDGAHSAVRDALGLPFRGHAFPEAFALADVAIHWMRTHDVFRAFLGPDGPLAVIPLPAPGQVRLIATIPDDPDDDGAPADGAGWERRFRERAGEKVTVRDVLWSSSFRIQRRRVQRLGEGRALLAGDAAHLHSPVGGQGMNLGLHDALDLAACLADAEQATPEALLAAYERTRLPAIDTVLRETTLFTKVVTARGAVPRLLRDAAVTVLSSLAPVRRRLLRGVAMLDEVHRRG